MKKKLLALIMITCLLLSACSSAPTPAEEKNSFGEEQSSSEEMPESESAKVGKFVAAYSTLDYINGEDRLAPTYKPYFDLFNQTNLSNGSKIQIFEEYRIIDFKKERYILMQYTNPSGTTGAIRFPQDEWELISFVGDNDIIAFFTDISTELSEENTNMFMVSVVDISEEDYAIKEAIENDGIEELIKKDYFTVSSFYPITLKDETYILEEGENSNTLIYDTNYSLEYARYGGASYQVNCHGCTYIYEDYETNIRIAAFCGGRDYSNYELRNFFTEFEVIDEEHLFSEMSSDWVFPSGMTGQTTKTVLGNGMSMNVTNYTNPSNHEMSFHWYGPETLGSQALENNGVLTLQEGEGLYKLNAQAIPINEIVDKYDVESYGLLEYQHFNENAYKSIEVCDIEVDGVRQSVIGQNLILNNYDELKAYGFENEEELFMFDKEDLIDDYNNTHIVYPIVDDNGYKGYATLLYGSEFNMPQDYVYFFTYVEREDIYDNERALDVISSIDYHLGIE